MAALPDTTGHLNAANTIVPAVGPDGTVYASSGFTVYAIQPAYGSIWIAANMSMPALSSPVLSPDGQLLYVLQLHTGARRPQLAVFTLGAAGWPGALLAALQLDGAPLPGTVPALSADGAYAMVADSEAVYVIDTAALVAGQSAIVTQLSAGLPPGASPAIWGAAMGYASNVATGDAPALCALILGSSGELWCRTTTLPVVAVAPDGTVITANADGWLMAVNSDGSTAWHSRVQAGPGDGSTTAWPVIVGCGALPGCTSGVVYVANPNANSYANYSFTAVSLDDGSVVWTATTSTPLQAPAIGPGGMVLAGSAYGLTAYRNPGPGPWPSASPLPPAPSAVPPPAPPDPSPWPPGPWGIPWWGLLVVALAAATCGLACCIAVRVYCCPCRACCCRPGRSPAAAGAAALTVEAPAGSVVVTTDPSPPTVTVYAPGAAGAVAVPPPPYGSGSATPHVAPDGSPSAYADAGGAASINGGAGGPSGSRRYRYGRQAERSAVLTRPLLNPEGGGAMEDEVGDGPM
jgi:hypothetical protein